MRRSLLLVPLALVLGTTGCTPTVTLTPAPHATDARCAGVIVRLPADIDGAEKRITDAQGTAAWGTPASATLLCGVDAPTGALQCFDVGAVQWLVDDSAADAVYTTYGRRPAVQVVVRSTRVSRSDVLPAVSDAIATATSRDGRRCTGGSDAPTPSPSS